MSLRRVLAAVVVGALVSACQSSGGPSATSSTPSVSPRTEFAGSTVHAWRARPSLFFLELGRQRLLAVDVRTGKRRVVPLPHLAIGDYPFQLVRVGNRLVFPCRGGTCDIDTSLTRIERLGDSWFD